MTVHNAEVENAQVREDEGKAPGVCSPEGTSGIYSGVRQDR